MSSINSASNHQPVLIGVAQHGSLDDAVYFTASDNPAGETGTNGNNGQGGSGTGTNNDLPIGAGQSATALSDSNLAPASTTPNIGAAQTSLAASVSSSEAANGGAEPTSVALSGSSSESTSAPAQAQTTTQAQGTSIQGGRRQGGRFNGGRFTRFGNRRFGNVARAEE